MVGECAADFSAGGIAGASSTGGIAVRANLPARDGISENIQLTGGDIHQLAGDDDDFFDGLTGERFLNLTTCEREFF